jgi:hypothetical protein
MYRIAYGNSAIVICSVVTCTSGRLCVYFWVLGFGRAYGAVLCRVALLFAMAGSE